MVIAGEDACETIELYLSQVAPGPLERVEVYSGEQDAFDEFRITEQIEKVSSARCGCSWRLFSSFIIVTEAMTVVDVNTGVQCSRRPRRPSPRTTSRPQRLSAAAPARHRRHHRGRLHRHGACSNRDLVLRRRRVPQPRPHQHQVAEVTSLGSRADDPQEARPGPPRRPSSENWRGVRGRGVIVHDPVVKHRPPPPRSRSAAGGRPATARPRLTARTAPAARPPRTARTAPSEERQHARHHRRREERPRL